MAERGVHTCVFRHNHHQHQLTWPFSTWTLNRHFGNRIRLHPSALCVCSTAHVHFFRSFLLSLIYCLRTTSTSEPTNDQRLVSFRFDVHLIYIRRWHVAMIIVITIIIHIEERITQTCTERSQYYSFFSHHSFVAWKNFYEDNFHLTY